ncbi:porin [Paraburkholderia sp. J67]|uniref:porin n=1 Tax=Paraburkholderia sp. J67 TaxID=2805435 RepID=UPI002ABD5FF3|nr:porin [Paraburkholderia sp. J67]
MKKSFLAISIMTACAAASAQSSVTLYGRLDAGLEYMSGLPSSPNAAGQATSSTHRFRAEGGDWGTSLWGLKGVEDLGGGNKALFQLEGGFNAMNGNGPGTGEIFNRWATVGLANDNYGTFLLGQELFISNGVWDFDPFGQSTWSSGSLVRGRTWPSSSNNISYQSPKFYGLDFYGQYSLSNSTSWNGNGSTPQGRQDGAQITYSSALFQIRGLYDEIRNASTGLLYGAQPGLVNASNTAGGVFQSSRHYAAMINVFLGQFKIQGSFEALRSSGATGVLPGQPTALDHEWGGVTWQATPAAALIGAVYHANGNNGAGNATIYSVGGSYNLSKRTLLDCQVATIRNSKGANFSLDANNPGTSVATGNPLPGHSQTGVYAGIEHSF